MTRPRRPSSAPIPAVLLACVIIALFAVPALARKTYLAESYRTELRVQPDGSLRIREEIRMRFQGGPFTFVYRGLPLRRTEGIVDIASPDPIEIRPRRSRLDVTWRFAALRDTVRTFTIEYTARGAVLLGRDADRLRWRVFPEERAYAIEQASAAVVLPPGWPAPHNLRTQPHGRAFRLAVSADEAAAVQGPVHPQSVVLAFAPTSLEENEAVVLSADLEPGYITGNSPGWQQKEEKWRGQLPGVLILSSFILTFGLFWVFWSRAYLESQLNRGAAWTSPSAKVLALTSPPDDTSPALVGALTYGIVSSAPLLAMLFDLARRGIVRFEVGAKRFAWSSPQIRIRRGDRPATLTSWEGLLLESAFRKTEEDGSANWSRAGSEIQKLGSRFMKEVRAELVRRGDLDPRAMAARRGLSYRGIGAFALAALLLVVALVLREQFGPFGLIPILPALLVGAAALVAGATLYPHTAPGAQRVRAWRGFAKFLKEAGKGNLALDTGRFHQWLPLSVALGVAPAWVKAGKRWGLTTPEWFRSPTGDPGDIGAPPTVVAASSSPGGGGGGGAGGGGSSGAGERVLG